MDLYWIDRLPRNENGERPYVMWYLVDHVSKRCFATIAEPRDGNLLYVTDIRVSGSDRSFIELDAAKAYCEWAAFDDERRESKELEDSVKQPSEYGEVKPSRLKRVIQRLRELAQ